MNRQREHKYVRTLLEIADLLGADARRLDGIEDLLLVDQALAEFVQAVRDVRTTRVRRSPRAKWM